MWSSPVVWSVLDVAVRLAVGVVLILAGAAKVTSTPVWRDLWVASYRLLPGPLVRPVARALPFVEIAAGLALLSGAWGGAVAATAVFGLISVAVLGALARGLQVSCGCFGRLDKLLSGPIAVRNLVLTAACGAIAVHGHATPALADHPWPVQLAALGAMAGATAALLLDRRRRARRRQLEGLLLASGRTRPARPASPGPRRVDTWVEQPITTGGA